jgi:UDP-3-O-[3-hydroxymyristoyl] glucosamine N-acyltransferase
MVWIPIIMTISPHAIIESGATLGAGCSVGHFSVIRAGTRLGDGVSVGSHCEIGIESQLAQSISLEIGDGAVIQSHSIIYSGSRLGRDFHSGHHATIRDSVIIGNGVRVGNYSSVDRQVSIGDYTRIHSYAHIGRGSTIGEYCWIYSLVTLMNDPLPPSLKLEPVTIENMVTVLVDTQIFPGSILRSGSMVASTSTFEGELAKGSLAVGNPGEVVGKVKHLRNFKHGIQHPWYKHFIDYYPAECHTRILELASEIYESENMNERN